jgi:hypothetical protein
MRNPLRREPEGVKRREQVSASSRRFVPVSPFLSVGALTMPEEPAFDKYHALQA